MDLSGLEGLSQKEIMVMLADAMNDNQVSSQLDKENNKLKNNIDIDQFRESLDSMDEEEYNVIDKLVENATIKEIHALYESNKLNCEKLVIYYLKRIEKYDINKLNSIMELNPDVINIAKQKDTQPKTGKLYGIVVALKGNIDSGDKMHTTAGAYALRDNVAKEDSFVVSKLREEGAIIIGKTNLSEFANYKASMATNGYSVLGGQTKNPYGKFEVGGSSSGSAVAVTSNFATVAIGTETSGSIISPASQNSVVGIKPSVNLVSRNGIIPIIEAQDVAGVLAKTVADASLVLEVISGYDQKDEQTEIIKDRKIDFTNIMDNTSLEGIKIGVINSKFARSEEEDLFVKACKNFEDMGATIIDIVIDKQEGSDINVSAALNKGFEQDLNKYLSNTTIDGIKTLKDIVEFNKLDLDGTCPEGQVSLEAAIGKSDNIDEYYEIVEKNRSIARNIIDSKLESVDVLMSSNLGLISFYPAAGYPAITVPAGYKTTNEPVGLTFSASNLQEEKLIQIANAYEINTKHRKNPKLK